MNKEESMEKRPSKIIVEQDSKGAVDVIIDAKVQDSLAMAVVLLMGIARNAKITTEDVLTIIDAVLDDLDNEVLNDPQVKDVVALEKLSMPIYKWLAENKYGHATVIIEPDEVRILDTLIYVPKKGEK